MGNRHQTGTIQRAVNQFEASGLADAGTDGTGLDGLVQGVDAVFTHILDEALSHAVFKRNQLGAGEDVGLLDLGIDNIGGFVGHLASIGAIGLVAVVLSGVVAGRDHDARVAVIVTGGERKGRHRHQGTVDADFDTVGGQYLGGGAGEQIALDTAIVADGNSLGAALGFDPVSEALGGLAHHINVHAVGAGANDTAQTRGAELERHCETVLNGRVVALDAFQFGFEVGVVQISRQPAFIHILIHK